MEKSRFSNPITMIRRLKESGFTQEQAEAWVEIFLDITRHNESIKFEEEVKFTKEENKKLSDNFSKI